MATSLAVADLGKRLLEASRKGNAEEVRQLMATGAPITTDWLGTSPLHLAAQYGHTVTAEVLLRAGVSRDGKTKVEKTPLHLAAQHGHMEIAQMLVKCGATIHAVDMLNMTPLHWAVEAHSPVICKLLMEQGARIDIRNKFGKTPVDIVRYKGFIDLLEILLSSDFAQQENGTKRLSKNEDSLFIESKKRARTRKFPMTAGSWTVGEMQSAEKEERLKPKEPRLTSPNEIQSKQSMMGDSKSEAESANNLSSLVDAAAMVRSKVQSLNGNSKRITTSAASEAARKRPTIVTEASVLDTLATLATASTQMATSGSETSLQAQKVVSLPSTAVAPSYISIPGVQGPVQVVHAGANQPGFIHPGSLASGLPAGMIQLASPLAFNFLPGGRFQIGQPVVPGHPLGVPFQMPLQHTGIPGSHLVAVSNAQGQNVTFIGGLPPGQMAPRLANATDTTPSRPGVVTSPVSQGLAPVLTTNNIPATLPVSIGHHSTLASPQQLPSSTTAATYQSEARHGLSKASPATLAGIPHGIMSPPQPGITQQQLTPTQLASAIPYANIGPGLAPIPLVPVAGLGGIQLVPQALLPTQVLSAIRAGSPSSPHLQPQFVAPGGAYTFPMSPLNLSSILPTALSLSQLPVAQHGINTLAQQHMGTSLSQQAIANILTQQEAGALQTTLANAQQRLIIAGSQPNIKATHQSLVLGGAQTDSPSKPAQRGPVAEADVSTLSHDQRVIFSGAHVQQILAAQQAIAVQNVLNAHSAAGAQQAQGAQETTKQDQPPQGLIQQIYNAQARLQQDTPTVYQNVGAHHAVGTSNSSQQTAVSVAQIALSADQIMQPHFVNVANSQSVVAAMQKYQQTAPKSLPRTEQEATKEQPSIISQLTIATVEGKSPSSLMVTSAHSPRMPISPSNLMQKDDEMQGISPSRISPTKLRDSVSDAATEHTTAVNDHVNAGSDHVDAANDQMIRKLAATMGIPANSTNDIPPGSTVLSSNQALPHLQQLIYKQLQQQLQVQQQSGAPQPTKSPSPHQNETIKDEPISQSSMPSSPRQQQSPSHEFEDRTETQATTQSEYFWRVIEQENPDLKRQFAESELETELYSQDFSKQDEKPEERKVDDLLVKDESKERTPSPPTVSGVSDNGQRE